MPRFLYIGIGPEGRVVSEMLLKCYWARKFPCKAIPDLETCIDGLPELGAVIITGA